MKIVQKEDPVLRKKAQAVPSSEFGSKKLLSLIESMKEAVDKEQDGVALAAPQIGVSKRIFIVRYDRMESPSKEEIEVGVFINPEIIKSSRKKNVVDEGCLSVRGVYGKTNRYTRATVKAYDEHGNLFTRGGGGVLAQAFQHEIDHLNGTLFIDHATDLIDYPYEGV